MRRSTLYRLRHEATPTEMLENELEKLRSIEEEHPQIRRFDRATLPVRGVNEHEIVWASRCVDVIQAHVAKARAELETNRTLLKWSGLRSHHGAT